MASYSVPCIVTFALSYSMVLPGVEANAFLGRFQDPQGAADPEFERHLLAEIEVTLGSEHRSFTEKRLKRIEEDLRPMFAAMPKTSDGKLEHAAIGYMLHRAFVQRHGWFVRSLSSEDGSNAISNSSAVTTILEDKVSEDVIDAFERRMGTGGTGLHELAVLAATLEHLVHKEALDRLRLAYEAYGFQADDVMSTEESETVMEGYMSLYLLGGYLAALNSSSMTPAKVLFLRKNIEQTYPNWAETRTFFMEQKKRVAPKRDYLYFADVANVIEEVGEHFGEFQDQECLILRDRLHQLELPGAAGRVRLADFYRPAVHEGKFAFTESKHYLRQLGALDESDPANPRVIISNYVNGPSNCIASSNYYSVCCRDECENLLSHLERELLSPDAPPAQIAALVAALASRTEKARHKLSPWLLARLEEVGAHHGGRVPIHGRLFAQWMHYAYPRECPYPHIAGTINAVRMEDFLAQDANVQENLDQLVATPEEMQDHIEAGQNATTAEDSELTMWTLDEELLVTRPEMAPSLAAIQPGSLFSTGVRGLALVGAVFSVSFGLTSRVKMNCLQPVDVTAQKFLV